MEYLNRKSYEISYAVFRVASAVKILTLKERLENSAIKLIENVAFSNLSLLLNEIGVLESLIHLGGAVGYIGATNARILLRELGGFKSSVSNYLIGNNKEGIEEKELEAIFSKPPVVIDPIKQNPSEEDINQKANFVTSDIKFDNLTERPSSVDDLINSVKERSLLANFGSLIGNRQTEDFNPSNRQSEILKKIKEFGNCRMRDLINSFPDVSERTLRNDLQRICEQGLARRVGGGGPYSFYTVKA